MLSGSNLFSQQHINGTGTNVTNTGPAVVPCCAYEQGPPCGLGVSPPRSSRLSKRASCSPSASPQEATCPPPCPAPPGESSRCATKKRSHREEKTGGALKRWYVAGGYLCRRADLMRSLGVPSQPPPPPREIHTARFILCSHGESKHSSGCHEDSSTQGSYKVDPSTEKNNTGTQTWRPRQSMPDLDTTHRRKAPATQL